MRWWGSLSVLLLLIGLMRVRPSASTDTKELIEEKTYINFIKLNEQLHSTIIQYADNVTSPDVMFAKLRVPSTDTDNSKSRSAEVFHQTFADVREVANDITREHVVMMSNMAGCEHTTQIDCTSPFHNRYRSMDGTCNNLANPTWGSTSTHLKRILPARYEDGRNEPQGWNEGRLYNNFTLPSTRLVSTEVVSTVEVTIDPNHTYMVMLWGQFHDHDVTFTPTVAVNCKGVCEKEPPCFPIPIPENDPRITNATCMPFTRSAATCADGLLYVREQMNQITSYTDASNVYGSNNRMASHLRDYAPNVGKLRTGKVSEAGKVYMAFDEANKDCRPVHGEKVPCFLAGDGRNNEHIALTAIHTLFVREHNRIAEELRQLNPDMDGNTTYYETRKILGAVMQIITYDYYLPTILGPEGMEMLGDYTGYNEDADATITNSFATATYRFGHGQIRPVTFRLTNNLTEIPQGHIPLHEAFFSPHLMVTDGGIDPIVFGMIGVGVKQILPTEVLTEELTEKLFKLANTIALDLAALNLQRGRDHGLQSYNAYREHCGYPRAETFDDLAGEITDPEARRRLESTYGHPDNVDLWAGGMTETRAPGASVGPLFRCLLVEQFKALRDGDRFWYENPGEFTPAQLAELRKVTLGKIICDNGDNIARVQENVFSVENLEDWKPCGEIPRMDLSAWQDCCDSGFFNTDECYHCKYSKDNIGFLAADNCHNFIRCQKLSDGTVLKHPFCCPDNLFWNQMDLTCVRLNPRTAPYCPQKDYCDVRPDYYNCTLMPGVSADTFVHYDNGHAYTMQCALGTEYSPDLCKCDNSVEYAPPACEEDPLLHFTFNGDYCDCGCQRAAGKPYGHVRLLQGFPWSPPCPANASSRDTNPINCAMCVGPDGGHVEFGFLKNWFAGQQIKSFSLSLWLFQTGLKHVRRGLFGNGDCYHDPSIWLSTQNNTLFGGIDTETNNVFGLNDGTQEDRRYNLQEWVHVGLALRRRVLEVYVNGVKVDTRLNVKGGVGNTPVGSTIGVAYFDCIAYYWTGCIDDVRIYKRYVKEDEFNDIYVAGHQ